MTTRNWQRRSLRRVTSLGVGVTLSTAGLVALSTAAFAHANVVTGAASCALPLGSGYSIVWSVTNDWNLSETAQIASESGAGSSFTPQSFAIAASGD